MARMKITTPIPVLGIDTSKPGEYVTARATTDCNNVRIKRSLIEKRPGTELLGASLGERVLAMAELESAELTYFVRIGPTKFQELNKTTKVWTNRATTPLTGDESSQVSVAFPLLGGSRILCYTNYVDVIRKYSGGANDAVLGGSPPFAKFMLFYGGYLLLMHVVDGGDSFPWRVQWCDTGDPETWSGGDAGSTNLLEDSSDITGAGYFGQYFTVHKENSIYVGYLTNSTAVFRFERRETGAGTVANRTILTLPTGEQIYLARDGIRIFNGITAPLIDAPINNELRDYLNPAGAYKSWAKIVRELDECWIGVPLGGDTEPSTIYKFNYVTRQMYKDSRAGVTAVGDYKNTVGQKSWDELDHTWDAWVGPWNNIVLASLNPILVFGFSDGITSRENTGSSDDGEAISADWQSKDFTSEDYGIQPGYLMDWQGFQFWLKGTGSCRVYYSLDGGLSFTLAGSVTLTAEYPTDYAPQMVYFQTLGTRIRVKVVHDTVDKTFTMKNFAVVAVPREEVGQ